MGPGRWWLVPWLLVAAAAQVVGFEVVRRGFVDSPRGQWLDTAALAGNTIGQRHIDELVDLVLGAMTVVSLLVATIVIGFIAVLRRRLALAVLATILIAGANLTTQLLKRGIERPEYGIDLARAAAGNSLPSGHTTVAASVAVALVLVLPPRLRPVAALAGAGYAALAGVATLAAGWHRPSDAVAALLVVGAWAAVIGLALAALTGPGQVGPAPRPHRVVAIGLAAAAGLLLVMALAAMAATDRAIGPGVVLGRGELFVAYAGGAAGIASVACLVMAVVLATAQLVVPPDRSAAGLPAAGAATRPTAAARRR